MALAKGYVRKRSGKAGLPPGVPVYVGERRVETVRITAIDFNDQSLKIGDVLNVEDCVQYRDKPTVTWISVEGLHEAGVIARLGEIFGIHPLLIEDVLNSEQRPKAEVFPDCALAILKVFGFDPDRGRIETNQVSIVIGRNFVLTFNEERLDIFEPLMTRLRSEASLIRKAGADMLAYAILDAAIDSTFGVLEDLGEYIEATEDELVATTAPTPAMLRKIHNLKSELIHLKKSVWPLRGLINNLNDADTSVILPGTRIYIRDLSDHVVQVIETVETLRELVSGMFDIYLSSVNNRMNEIMKILTIYATIFIPLTFIVGLYGMNFEYMPELKWRYGYFVVLGIMGSIAGGMLIYFRRRKWL